VINENDFTKITDEVIDKLEGGYYHPKMLSDGRVKDSRYGASGETMFGLDRKAGAGLSVYQGWATFWNKIDTVGARDKWSWNYGGGQYAPELKQLAGKVMYQEYKNFYNRYLSKESQAIVDSDPRLVFNFAYATWNGSGWFQRFAKVFNEAVAKGERNKEKLVDLVVAQRTQSSNSLIAQGGRKIASFIDEIKSVAISTTKTRGGIITIALVGIGISVYLYYILRKK
jgi:hypothetical protein